MTKAGRSSTVTALSQCTLGKPITFTLEGKELEAAQRWETRHRCIKGGRKGAVGSDFEYSFSPNSIGVAVSVKCHHCGKERNVTDYGSW